VNKQYDAGSTVNIVATPASGYALTIVFLLLARHTESELSSALASFVGSTSGVMVTPTPAAP